MAGDLLRIQLSGMTEVLIRAINILTCLNEFRKTSFIEIGTIFYGFGFRLQMCRRKIPANLVDMKCSSNSALFRNCLISMSVSDDDDLFLITKMLTLVFVTSKWLRGCFPIYLFCLFFSVCVRLCYLVITFAFASVCLFIIWFHFSSQTLGH